MAKVSGTRGIGGTGSGSGSGTPPTNAAIDRRIAAVVDKDFVDALDVDAETLQGSDATHYITTLSHDEVSGTGDAIILTPDTPLPAYVDGVAYLFVIEIQNTGPVTVNVSGLGEKDLVHDGAAALTALEAGELEPNGIALIQYDLPGDQFEIRILPRTANWANSNDNTLIPLPKLQGIAAVDLLDYTIGDNAYFIIQYTDADTYNAGPDEGRIAFNQADTTSVNQIKFRPYTIDGDIPGSIDEIILRRGLRVGAEFRLASAGLEDWVGVISSFVYSINDTYATINFESATDRPDYSTAFLAAPIAISGPWESKVQGLIDATPQAASYPYGARLRIFPETIESHENLTGDYAAILDGLQENLLSTDAASPITRLHIAETTSNTRLHDVPWDYATRERYISFQVSSDEAIAFRATSSTSYLVFQAHFFDDINNEIIATSNPVVMALGTRGEYPAKRGDLPGAATEDAAGLVEKATTGEMDAGTADKYPDAERVKAYVDANAGGSGSSDTASTAFRARYAGTLGNFTGSPVEMAFTSETVVDGDSDRPFAAMTSTGLAATEKTRFLVEAFCVAETASGSNNARRNLTWQVRKGTATEFTDGSEDTTPVGTSGYVAGNNTANNRVGTSVAATTIVDLETDEAFRLSIDHADDSEEGSGNVEFSGVRVVVTQLVLPPDADSDTSHDSSSDVDSRDHERISALEELTEDLELHDHESWSDETSVARYAVHILPTGTSLTTAALPGYPWALTKTVTSDASNIVLLRAAAGSDSNGARVRRVDSGDTEQAVYHGDWRPIGQEQGGFNYYLRTADAMTTGDVLTVQRATVDAHTRYTGEVTRLDEHTANPSAHQDSPRRQEHLGLDSPAGRRVYLTQELRHAPVEHIFRVSLGQLAPNDAFGNSRFIGASVVNFSAAPVNGPVATLDPSGFPPVLNAQRVAGIWQDDLGLSQDIYFAVAAAGALSAVTPTHIHISVFYDVRAAVEQVGNTVDVGGTDYRIMRTTGESLRGQLGTIFDNAIDLSFSVEYATGYITGAGAIDTGVLRSVGEYESLGAGEWVRRQFDDFASELGDYTLKAMYRLSDYTLAAYTAGPAVGRFMFNNASVSSATAFKLRPHIADSVLLSRRMRNDADITIAVGSTSLVGTVTSFTYDSASDTYEVNIGAGQGRPNLIADSVATVTLDGQWEAQVDARATAIVQSATADTRRDIIRAVPQNVYSYGAFSPGELTAGVPSNGSGSSYSDDGPTAPTNSRWHRLPSDAIAAASGRPLWEEVLPVAYDTDANAWGVGQPLYVRLDDVGSVIYTSNPNTPGGSDTPFSGWTHFSIRQPNGDLGPWIAGNQGPAVETLLFETGVRNFPSSNGVTINVTGGGYFDMDNYYALRGEIIALGPLNADGVTYDTIYFQDAILDEHAMEILEVHATSKRTADTGMLRVALGGSQQVASMSIVNNFHTKVAGDWQQSGLGNPGIFTEFIFQSRFGRERQLREFVSVFMPAHARGAGNFKLYGLSRG